MAFKSAEREYYQCNSTDPKLTVGIKPGSKLEVLDKGEKYVFDGTKWNPDLTPTSINGSFAKGNKVTDADATDRTIDATSDGGFKRLVLDCSDCASEMTFTVDEAIASATKFIYVKPGMTWDDYVSGNILHYSGSGTFRYQMFN